MQPGNTEDDQRQAQKLPDPGILAKPQDADGCYNRGPDNNIKLAT
jgi:hypothetical protein